MLSFAERRRLALVAAITLVAIPVFVLSGKDSSAKNPTEPVTSVVVAPTDTGPAEPAFLPDNTGPIVPEIITVNVPAAPSGSTVNGTASFIRWRGDLLGLRPCATPHALIGAIITVTNINNGRSLECNNVSIQSLTGGNIILIHTEVFLEIADLIDAPIPVQISF